MPNNIVHNLRTIFKKVLIIFMPSSGLEGKKIHMSFSDFSFKVCKKQRLEKWVKIDRKMN